MLNAANEEAVAAFLNGGLRFTDIHAVNAEALSAELPGLPVQPALEDLLELDRRARDRARRLIAGRRP